MQDPNISSRCKIFRESMFLGLNFTLHTHTPVYKYTKYPWGITIVESDIVFDYNVFVLTAPKKDAAAKVYHDDKEALVKLRMVAGHIFVCNETCDDPMFNKSLCL